MTARSLRCVFKVESGTEIKQTSEQDGRIMFISEKLKRGRNNKLAITENCENAIACVKKKERKPRGHEAHVLMCSSRTSISPPNTPFAKSNTCLSQGKQARDELK